MARQIQMTIMARRRAEPAIREVIAIFRRGPGGMRQPIADNTIPQTVSISASQSSIGIAHHARIVTMRPMTAHRRLRPKAAGLFFGEFSSCLSLLDSIVRDLLNV